MEKVFEDYFSEAQANMVSIVLDVVSKQADKLFIYASCEHNIYSFNFFVEINNKYYFVHQLNKSDNNFAYNISDEIVFLALKDGVEEIKYIEDACIKFNREMPTEMKMIYDVKTGKFNANYQYDFVYTDKEDLISMDIFNQWFKEVSQQEK